MTKIRTYTDLMKLRNFEERFNYLKLDGKVGLDTFGHERFLNQTFYKSDEWKKVRDYCIIRDKGCDLAVFERPIYGTIFVHHMNSITKKDILERNPNIFDPEFLVCVSFNTHNAVHYGDIRLCVKEYNPRTKNDTIPWR